MDGFVWQTGPNNSLTLLACALISAHTGHGPGRDAPVPREGVVHPREAEEEEGPWPPARHRRRQA